MIIPAQEVFLPTFFPQPEHGKCILVVEDETFVRSSLVSCSVGWNSKSLKPAMLRPLEIFSAVTRHD
jgi:hypothetical protein